MHPQSEHREVAAIISVNTITCIGRNDTELLQQRIEGKVFGRFPLHRNLRDARTNTSMVVSGLLLSETRLKEPIASGFNKEAGGKLQRTRRLSVPEVAHREWF